jgi:hypothetical protein
MNFIQQVKRDLNDPLTTFRWFERFIAAVCIAIPAVLRITDQCDNCTGFGGFRPSISNYVYMPHSYIFGLLLTMAAMLFIFNGAVYFRNDDGRSNLKLNKNGKYYNVALGLFLLGVIVLPHKEYPVPHYIFATLFFVGNAVVTGVFHEPQNRKLSITMAVLTVASLVPALLCIIPLFWAEWLSLIVIAIHFILEARK